MHDPANSQQPMQRHPQRPNLPWALDELLELAGIGKSAFRQMRRIGAVEPPTPPTAGARYGPHHLKQIKSVLRLAQKRDLSRTAACELVAAERLAVSRSRPTRARAKTAAVLCFVGRIRGLAESAFLVYDKRLSKGASLLLDNAARSIRHELMVMQVATAVPRKPQVASKVHRIR